MRVVPYSHVRAALARLSEFACILYSGSRVNPEVASGGITASSGLASGRPSVSVPADRDEIVQLRFGDRNTSLSVDAYHSGLFRSIMSRFAQETNDKARETGEGQQVTPQLLLEYMRHPENSAVTAVQNEVTASTIPRVIFRTYNARTGPSPCTLRTGTPFLLLSNQKGLLNLADQMKLCHTHERIFRMKRGSVFLLCILKGPTTSGRICLPSEPTPPRNKLLVRSPPCAMRWYRSTINPIPRVPPSLSVIDSRVATWSGLRVRKSLYGPCRGIARGRLACSWRAMHSRRFLSGKVP